MIKPMLHSVIVKLRGGGTHERGGESTLRQAFPWYRFDVIADRIRRSKAQGMHSEIACNNTTTTTTPKIRIYTLCLLPLRMIVPPFRHGHTAR